MLLDKSTLQGCTAEVLAEFSAEHQVLLPNVLFYEIATQDRTTAGAPDWTSYFEKLKGIRPTVCFRIPDVIAEERRTAVPSRAILDYKMSRKLWTWLRIPFNQWGGPMAFISPEEYRKNLHQVVDSIKARCQKVLDNPTSAAAIRRVPALAEQRHCTYARAFYSVLKELTPNMWKEFYPRLPLLANRRSMAFMDFMLGNYCGFRCFLDGVWSASNDVIFNKVADIDYILYLVVADGIVSGDGGMREVAKAFFPHRLVLDSLSNSSANAGLRRRAT
jgi:hypothetical protein